MRHDDSRSMIGDPLRLRGRLLALAFTIVLWAAIIAVCVEVGLFT